MSKYESRIFWDWGSYLEGISQIGLLNPFVPYHLQFFIHKDEDLVTIFPVLLKSKFLEFGGKFNCVCTRPCSPSGRDYQRGVEVKLRIKKLESSQKFLGYEKEMSLLEAECVLIGLHKEK